MLKNRKEKMDNKNDHPNTAMNASAQSQHIFQLLLFGQMSTSMSNVNLYSAFTQKNLLRDGGPSFSGPANSVPLPLCNFQIIRSVP